MREELSAVQQGVQQRFFEGFAGELRDLSTTVIPVFQSGLNDTADTLNSMAIGASNAAQNLAEDGTLGRAISGATDGLFNLRDVPAQVLTALFQLAEAGAPTFERLTAAAANAATNISGRLTDAFESGALEQAVGTAADLLASLAPIAVDAFGIIQNLIEATAVEGGDLFQVIGSLVSALSEFTGTQAFQEAIGALTETMGVLAQNVAPLLISALEVIAPIFTNLAGPVQQLVIDLGAGLAPIITALGPVFDALSITLGQLVLAISPLLPIIGSLIAQIGPILTPIIQTIGEVIGLLAPVVLSLVTALAGALQPILAVLPSLLQPILDALIELVTAVIPILNNLIIQLTPVLDELSLSFVELLIVLTPLIVQLLRLATDVLVLLTPAIGPIIAIAIRLSQILSGNLASTITNIVIPAINTITALLRGDFSTAFDNARAVVVNTVTAVVDRFTALPRLIISAISSLGSRLFDTMTNAGERLVDAAQNQTLNAVQIIGDLPRRAFDALGDLGGFLFDAGRDLIQGFIDGILSLGGAVSDAVGGIIDGATGWLPGSPAERGPLSGSGYVLLRGQRFTEDFARGLSIPLGVVEQAADRIAQASVGALGGSFGAMGTPSRGIDIPRGILEQAADRIANATITGVSRPTLPLGFTPSTGGTFPTAAEPFRLIINIDNNGVIGSRTELLNWLTRALDQLARQNRLPSNRNELPGGVSVR